MPDIVIEDIRDFLFAKSIISDSGVMANWSNYGGYFYPTFPEIEGFPYMYLSLYSGNHVLTYTNEPLYWNDTMKTCYHPGDPQYYYQINLGDIDFSKWDSYSFYQIPDSPKINERYGIVYMMDVVWSNVDILSTKTNPVYLYFAGSEPTTILSGGSWQLQLIRVTELFHVLHGQLHGPGKVLHVALGNAHGPLHFVDPLAQPGQLFPPLADLLVDESPCSVRKAPGDQSSECFFCSSSLAARHSS